MLPQRFYPLVGLVVVFLALCFPLVVKADAAPPQAPPGSTIATGDFVTHVQMVSEEVTIDVQTYHGPTVNLDVSEEILSPFSGRTLSEGNLVGYVTASFTMQNQGDEPESFDVWFPIGASDGYGAVVTVANFQALVNGNLVETGRRETEDHGESLPWATWTVDFPVGEQVQLIVTYDLPATYEYPLLQFDYILETGSGWWGVIESGTFTFTLPFEATDENASLRAGEYGRFPIDDVVVSGNEMRWAFSNLEPDQDDNIQLSIMTPSIWEAILAARAGVEANPSSADSHIRLAHALTEAMGTHNGIISGQQFIPETVQAYQNALALAPDDIENYIDYIEFLFLASEPTGPVHPQLEPTLRQALEIAPDDERLLELEGELREFEVWAAQFRAPPAEIPTATPEETPTPTLTLTPTPPAPTPTLAATADAPPPPTQQSRGFPSWVVIVGSVVLLFALAIVLRGQADDDASAPG